MLTYQTDTRLYVWNGGIFIAVFVKGFKNDVGRIKLHAATESNARLAIKHAESVL